MINYQRDFLYQNFIRYERLYGMTMQTFGSTSIVDCTKATSIDIYIDANSMTKSLYDYEGLEAHIGGPPSVASFLINLAAHIRHYFLSRHGTWCRVFIVYGDNLPDNILTTMPDYNLNYHLKMDAHPAVGKLLDSSFEILETLCPYIPQVYFYREKDCGTETAFIVDWLIRDSQRKKNKYPGIIYSRDTYMYQVVANRPSEFLFRPKKSNTDDVSFSVFKSNLYDAYRYNELKNIPSGINNELHASLIGLAFAYAGLKQRNFKSICSFKNAQNKLLEMVNHQRIINGYNSSTAIYRAIENGYDNTGISPNVAKRYSILDFVAQTEYYVSRPNRIESSVVDINDPDAVRYINNTYFRRFPLDLQNF